MDILFVLGLVVLNGLFSLSEFSVVSVRKAKMVAAARKGDRGAARVVELSRDPTRFLSTIQTGITVIGILSGAVGEAALTADLTVVLSEVSWLETHARTVSFWTVVLGLVFVSVVLGELIPKRIALAYPEQCAKATALPMLLFAKIGSPFVKVLSGATNLLLRPFAGKLRSEPEVSDEEVLDLLHRGAASGVFHAAESDLMKRVLSLGDRKIRELMLHRQDVEWLDVDATADEIRDFALREHTQLGFPVCRGDFDHVEKVVLVVDLLRAIAKGETFALESLGTRPIFVPEHVPAVKLIDTLNRAQQWCAVVVDEFGGAAGYVESSDLRETLIAGVAVYGESEQPPIVMRSDGSWLVEGDCPLSDLKNVLGVESLPGEGSRYLTVAGLMLVNLGHIPAEGEIFEWDGHRLEVIDLDGRRIDKLLLTTTSPPKSAADDADPAADP